MKGTNPERTRPLKVTVANRCEPEKNRYANAVAEEYSYNLVTKVDLIPIEPNLRNMPSHIIDAKSLFI